MATITKIRNIVLNPMFFEEENSALVDWMIDFGTDKPEYCSLTTNVVRAELCLNQHGVFIHHFYIMDKDKKVLYKTSSCEECVEYLNARKKDLILSTLISFPELDERTRALIRAVGLYEEGGNQ